ncbi:alkene reductase [Radicibacter daui]|uniref:alkene reductase n=1 Tax=Radicibacter daui TaxID=3064829 RepID=UPI004046EA58
MVNHKSLLFTPARLGDITLANRVVMAPLTRSRADANDAVTDLTVEYYRQRASAGLIITEASPISQQGKGYAFTPGIWSSRQVEAWRRVTDAVHAEGGKIVIQLWHVGRISHPSLQKDGALPVAPSAIQPEGQAFTETGFQPFVTPRALDVNELPGIVEDYRRATRNALEAGFDGVEIHAANGYLLDQFLRDKTNHRTDTYGGSIDNRMRFPLEVVDAVVSVAGAGRTGIRISPITPSNDIADSNPEPLFRRFVTELSARGLAYLHVVEGATGGDRQLPGGFDTTTLRPLFKGAYMGNNGYDLALAQKQLETDAADVIAFGRPFIANPDLVERLRLGAPLNTLDRATLYGGSAKGYTDYPALTDAQKKALVA